jgi:hypothetical protein
VAAELCRVEPGRQGVLLDDLGHDPYGDALGPHMAASMNLAEQIAGLDRGGL